MIEFRFHGRGGQGAKVASRILGRSGFLAGLYAQDFALFGAERQGATVVSCARLSEQPIDKRGYADAPNLVVVMDHTLLKEAREQIFHGVDAVTPVVINGTVADSDLPLRQLPPADFTFIDLSGICRRAIGVPLVSAAAAAVAARSIGSIPLTTVVAALKIEFADLGMARELAGKNETAAREAYALAPVKRPTDLRPLLLSSTGYWLLTTVY